MNSKMLFYVLKRVLLALLTGLLFLGAILKIDSGWAVRK